MLTVGHFWRKNKTKKHFHSEYLPDKSCIIMTKFSRLMILNVVAKKPNWFSVNLGCYFAARYMWVLSQQFHCFKGFGLTNAWFFHDPQVLITVWFSFEWNSCALYCRLWNNNWTSTHWCSEMFPASARYRFSFICSLQSTLDIKQCLLSLWIKLLAFELWLSMQFMER